MPDADFWIIMGLSVVFVLLGEGAFFWGRKEEKDYYKAISARHDVREYMEHTPERPEPGALKIGGLIAIVVGLVMLIMGGAFLLLG
jgi:hypothetical protein